MSIKESIENILHNDNEIIEEKLTPEQRLQKQIKNFGVELEFASYEESESIKEQLSDNIDISHLFGGGGNFVHESNASGSGISRDFIVGNDASAAFSSAFNNKFDKDKLDDISNDIAQSLFYDINQYEMYEEFKNNVFDNPTNIGQLEGLTDIDKAGLFTLYILGNLKEIFPKTPKTKKTINTKIIEFIKKHNTYNDDGEVIDEILNDLEELNFYEYILNDEEINEGYLSEVKEINETLESYYYMNQFKDEIIQMLISHFDDNIDGFRVKEDISDNIDDYEEIVVINGQREIVNMLDKFNFEGFKKVIEKMLVDGEYMEAMADGWDAPNGIEIRTPRITLNDQNVKDVSEVLSNILMTSGGISHDGAGLHVHIGILPDTNTIHALRMAKYITDREDVFKEISGREESSYAETVRHIIERVNTIIASYEDPGRTSNELEALIYDLPRMFTKKHNINFESMQKGTVEFRLGSSKLARNPESITNYINFAGKVVEYGLSDNSYEFEYHDKDYIFTLDSTIWQLEQITPNGIKTINKGKFKSPVPKNVFRKEDMLPSGFVGLSKEETRYIKTIFDKLSKSQLNGLRKYYQDIIDEMTDDPIDSIESTLESETGLSYYNDFFKWLKTGKGTPINFLLWNSSMNGINDIPNIKKTFKEFNFLKESYIHQSIKNILK